VSVGSCTYTYVQSAEELNRQLLEEVAYPSCFELSPISLTSNVNADRFVSSCFQLSQKFELTRQLQLALQRQNGGSSFALNSARRAPQEDSQSTYSRTDDAYSEADTQSSLPRSRSKAWPVVGECFQSFDFAKMDVPMHSKLCVMCDLKVLY